MDDEQTAVEAAQEALQLAFDREPADTDWGFCAYGDAPAAIGGGMSAFCWFASREEMLDFIATHALYMNLPRSDLDLDAIEEALDVLVGRMRDGHLDDAAALPALNELLRHASQFTWLGTFRSLCDGETEAARQILNEFRRRDSSSVEVGENELGDFRQFLRDYCIR
jgi:hypothetical protein